MFLYINHIHYVVRISSISFTWYVKLHQSRWRVWCYLGPSHYRDSLFGYRIPIIKIRQSWERLIFIIGIPLVVTLRLLIATGPCVCPNKYIYTYFGRLWWKFYETLISIKLAFVPHFKLSVAVTYNSECQMLKATDQCQHCARTDPLCRSRWYVNVWLHICIYICIFIYWLRLITFICWGTAYMTWQKRGKTILKLTLKKSFSTVSFGVTTCELVLA